MDESKLSGLRNEACACQKRWTLQNRVLTGAWLYCWIKLIRTMPRTNALAVEQCRGHPGLDHHAEIDSVVTHLDLFTGLGAFSIGFEREGFRTIAQVEIEKNCQKLLAAKWPKVKRHDDVSTFEIDMMSECPKVVTFGSPCQDLSVAGQRAGMAGERSGLFYAATRIIRRLVKHGLEFALWENVEGAFSSNERRDFAGVLSELGECGALDIGWRVLDCQYFGLAQRRRRVFLVADFRGRRAAQILSFTEGLQGHPAPGREAGKGVASTISASTPSRRNGGSNPTAGSMIPAVAAPCGHHHRRDDLDNDTYLVMAHGQANAETVSDGSPSLTCNHEAPILFRTAGNCGPFEQGDKAAALTNQTDPSSQILLTAIGFGAKDHGQDAIEELSPTLRSGVHKESHENGGVMPAVCFQPRYFTRDNKTGGAASCSDQSAALSSDHANGDSAPHVAAHFGVRRLTPRECERLMGLPDDWTAGFSDSVRYRMIGNSAAVPVIRWLAKAMREALSK